MDPLRGWLPPPFPIIHTASCRLPGHHKVPYPIGSGRSEIQGQNQRSSLADDVAPLPQVQDFRSTETQVNLTSAR
jgi:hypothetical protein